MVDVDVVDDVSWSLLWIYLLPARDGGGGIRGWKVEVSIDGIDELGVDEVERARVTLLFDPFLLD